MPIKSILCTTMMKQRTRNYCIDAEQEIINVDFFEHTDECTCTTYHIYSERSQKKILVCFEVWRWVLH